MEGVAAAAPQSPDLTRKPQVKELYWLEMHLLECCIKHAAMM
jgi:hypothetical protein